MKRLLAGAHAVGVVGASGCFVLGVSIADLHVIEGQGPWRAGDASLGDSNLGLGRTHHLLDEPS